MHELSICTAIARIAEEHAAGRPVDRVCIEVGHLRQVVPETLSWSWGLVVADTALAGSVLDIHEVPAEVRCEDCGATTTLDRPIPVCPCGSNRVILTSGEELLVTALELAVA